MQKYIILVFIIGVCWLGLSYHEQLQIQRGENLVTDAYYGDLVAVKNDVEQGAPLFYQFTFNDEEKNYELQTFGALHAAASAGNEDIILYLLEQGLPLDIRNNRGWTPLFVAARDGQAEAAKLLIFKGADLNIQTDLGATVLTMVLTQKYPTQKERLSLLEYMLKRGADVHLRDVYGHDALYYATLMKNDEAVKLLRQYLVKDQEE